MDRDDSPSRAASLHGVDVEIDGNRILDGVTLHVEHRGHLAVLGPNGAGKTTLLRVLATYRYPTRGAVEVLGVRFGAADLRALRPRVGFVSVAIDPLVRARASALALVGAARVGSTWPAPKLLENREVRAAAEHALERVGAGHLGDRRVDTLSQGERQRVRIARALVCDPELLLLDEPFAGLDLGGRELLVGDLDALLAEPDGPTVVMVTHHAEELPSSIGAAVLMRDGGVVAAGAAREVLTSANVSQAFGLEVDVVESGGRWWATARAALDRPAPTF